MKFRVMLTNRLKMLWPILFIVGVSAIGGLVIPILDAYNSLLTAIVGVILFFGGGWLFLRIEHRICEPICISILPDRIVESHQQTGVSKTWLFDEIVSYRFSSEFRGMTFLRLTLQSGEKVRLSALDVGLSSVNTDRFEAMIKAFEEVWHRHKGK